MTLIHRFSTTTFMQYDKRLQDDVRLRTSIIRGRKHSTDADLTSFIAVLHNRTHELKLALGPLKDHARSASGAKGAVAAIRWLGGKSSNIAAPLNAFENVLVKATAVPLVRVYVASFYDLSIHEVPDPSTASGYCLELRLNSKEGAQVIAASNWPLKAKGGGVQLKVKPQPTS
jgi:hypothetical protein